MAAEKPQLHILLPLCQQNTNRPTDGRGPNEMFPLFFIVPERSIILRCQNYSTEEGKKRLQRISLWS